MYAQSYITTDYILKPELGEFDRPGTFGDQWRYDSIFRMASSTRCTSAISSAVYIESRQITIVPHEAGLLTHVCNQFTPIYQLFVGYYRIS